MNSIFVSYRRSDSSAIVGRVIDRLEQYFGKHHIFRDLDSIDYGDEFGIEINCALEECEVLLAIIGNDWIDISNDAGERRLDNPNDWVRFEVSKALDQRVHVIPVLVEDSSMPSPSQLPDNLKPLAKRNAAKVRDDPDFNTDMKRLCESVRKHLPNWQYAPDNPTTNGSGTLIPTAADNHQLTVILDIQGELSRISTLVNRYLRGESIDALIVGNDIPQLTAVYEDLNAKKGLIGDDFYQVLSEKGQSLINLINARGNPEKALQEWRMWKQQSAKVDQLISDLRI